MLDSQQLTVNSYLFLKILSYLSAIFVGKITKLMGLEGLKRVEMEEASAGHIVADAYIGDPTQALPLIKVGLAEKS